MPLSAPLWALPLPIPVPPTFGRTDQPIEQQLKQAIDGLRVERAKLTQLSQYRMQIVSHLIARPPVSIEQVNEMIADQRAVVETMEEYVRELAAVPAPAPEPAPEA